MATLGLVGEVHVEATTASAVDACANWMVARIRKVLGERPRCSIALSGGSTPGPLYRKLAKAGVEGEYDSGRIDLFLVDERCLPPDHAESNARLVRDTWLALDPRPTLARPRGEVEDWAAEADHYADALPDMLDIVVLGMGADGHTASLFPGDRQAVATNAAVLFVSDAPKPPPQRWSLSPRTLRGARDLVTLVTGSGKAEAVQRALEGRWDPLETPVQVARGGTWFLGAEAATQLTGKTQDPMTDSQDAGKADFGMVGLGVMGRNLALNVEDHGFSVAVWNLETEWTDRFVAENAGKRLVGTKSLAELVKALAPPRRIMLMVTAGKAVDSVVEQLEGLLEEGDAVIDGGNSRFEDTRRREERLRARGLRFFGVGVSGGEEGARFGPSLMPGGDVGAYEFIRPIFESIAAKTDSGPCVTHVGPDGAGHFVKMVHNGIEYADMQFIAESYDVLHRGHGVGNAELARTFSLWNEGVLESFLIEITAKIFEVKDAGTEAYTVDSVLDKAGQKGTGRWTCEAALALGVPVPSIQAAIHARGLSSMKDERVAASEVLPAPAFEAQGDFSQVLHDGLYAAKVCAYAQGLDLIATASKEYGWNVNLSEIARIWKGGCIIRARLLDEIMSAYANGAEPANLMVAAGFAKSLSRNIGALREVVAFSARSGIPAPAMSASLAYFDSYRTARLPQNLTQAQRDAFGAHTFLRTDDPTGAAHHVDWLG